MQMKCESDKKEKELIEKNKAANLGMQSKHEDFTKLSVNFEHFRGESQSLKAERDELLQDIEKRSQSEATLQKEFQVQAQEIQTLQVKCGCVYLMQEPKNLFISGAGAKTCKYYQKFGSPTTGRNSAASKHCQASQRRNSGIF